MFVCLKNREFVSSVNVLSSSHINNSLMHRSAHHHHHHFHGMILCVFCVGGYSDFSEKLNF